MEKLYIIDASGYLYSSYFAIRNMTNHEGKSTNALYGFIRSVLKLVKDFHPTHVVAIFDGPNNAKKREEIYPAYKAHRSSTPPDLGYQIDWAREFCSLAGLPFLNIPDVEADDTMGTIASWGCANSTVYLCTSDKDMCQMVSDRVFLLNTRKENLVVGPSEVQQLYGVAPAQIVDLFSMIGDSSDNIPGLSGIGPKTAAALLNQFGSLDALIAHPEAIAGEKKRSCIMQNIDMALISRRLVQLDLAVEIPKDQNFYQFHFHPSPELKAFYSRFDFRSLLKELEKDAPPQTPLPEESAATIVDDEGKLETLIRDLHNCKEICFSVTAHKATLAQSSSEEVLTIELAVEEPLQPEKYRSWTIPFDQKIETEKLIASLKPLFGNKNLSFFGYDVKPSLHLLYKYGIEIASISFDLLLASYLLNSHHRNHTLEDLCETYLSGQTTGLKAHLELKKCLEKEIRERKFEKLMYELELPLLRVLAKMEQKGIFVDVDHLKQLSVSIQHQIEEVQKDIYELAGETFNLNSPKQLSHILQDKLQIRLPKKTATGFSTNAEILEVLKADHPIAEKLLQYRTLEKLRSTYIDNLPLSIDPNSGRIHCTFNQSVAATGRLSCQNPNLQNIPIRSSEGLKIRQAFRPQNSGWSYLSADYSQIELRLLAHFSEDETLTNAFNLHEDIHAYTAAALLGIPLREVTKEMRSNAKAVNFGIIYGQQAFGLAKELRTNVKTAAAFIDTYFKRYPKIKGFIEECKVKARQSGYTTTITGRERLIPEINSPNERLRAQAERLAVNTPLQGTAADLIKIAMLQIDQALKDKPELKGYPVLQIHDELIFEVPDDEIAIFSALVKTVMENVFALRVPLIVDISVGKNWKEC